VGARLYTRSLQALPYELFAADDEDADAQLELLARSLSLAQEISVRWPNGWLGYGWPNLGR
jgi:hypothetical protein